MRNRSLRCTLAFALILNLVIIAALLVARTNRVVGRVMDAETGVPLAGSHITLPNGTVLVADVAGAFSLNTPRDLISLYVESPGYRPLSTECNALFFTWSPIPCRCELQPRELVVRVSDALDTSILVKNAIVYANGVPMERAGVSAGVIQYTGKRFTPPTEITVAAAGYQPWHGIHSGGTWVVDARLQPTSLAGVVLAADTGELIPGALIETSGISTRADEKGKFQFLRLHGMVQLHASHEGYHGYYGELIDVDASSPGERVEVRMPPIFTPGVVRDRYTAVPIVGAVISTNGQSVVSNANGSFQLRALQLGDKITIEAPDHFSATLRYAGEPALDVMLQNMRTNVIVRDDRTGRPVEAASIETILGITHTNPQGIGTIIGLHPGEWITVRASDYFSYTFQYAGEPRREVLLRQIRVDVAVRDALTGRPIEGAAVQASSKAASTNADGHCTLIGLLSGQPVTVTAANYRVAQLNYAGGGSLVVQLSPVHVALTIVDADTGATIQGLRLTENNVELLPISSGEYVISEWNPGRVFTLRAAGYRRRVFSLDLARFQNDRESDGLLLSPADPSPEGWPTLRLEVPRFIVRGIYIPLNLLSQEERVWALLDMVKETELNTVVIDMKGDYGTLAFPSNVPLAREMGIVREDVLDITDLLRQCREAGIYTIARQVVFKDHPLALARPAWAAVTADGAIWLDKQGSGWANPFLQDVRDYNIALAEEIAALGFDEIQFDYVRFPSDGNVAQIIYAQENSRETRSAAIASFMEQAAAALRPYGIFTSTDVFGLTVWVPPEHDMGIGQRVVDVAPHIDYLCPMIYPSTFSSGSFGFELPSDYPYEVIYRSTIQAGRRVPETVEIRPWLQAYWYTLDEQIEQKQAATDAGASGWCFWNASGIYSPDLFQENPGE